MEIGSSADVYLRRTPAFQIDQLFTRFTIEFIMPRLQGARVLEMGVGHQTCTPELVKRFSTVTTVEIEQQLLETLRPSMAGRRWTGVCSSFEDYQPEEPFDAIVATYVLEHVADPLALLKHMRGWLAPGGRIAITVPNGVSLHRRLAVTMGLSKLPWDLGEADRALGHYRCFTPWEMESVVVAAGYRIAEKAGLAVKVVPFAQMTQCTEEQLHGLFQLGLALPMEYTMVLYYAIELV